MLLTTWEVAAISQGHPINSKISEGPQTQIVVTLQNQAPIVHGTSQGHLKEE